MTQLMILPLMLGVILTGILAYLGIHIVEREVIFVDLALAQIAALGAAVGVLVGLEPHGIQAYGASLVFVLLGAYLPLINELERRYPGGIDGEVRHDGQVDFYAYEVEPPDAIGAP